MFSLGTSEAMREAVLRRRETESFTADPVPGDVVRRAVAAAVTAPSPEGAEPRFVLLESETARKDFANTLKDPVLERAPYLVVPCRLANTEFAVASLGAAVANFLVALSAEGWGATWRAADAATVRELLALPSEWEPLGVIAVGKPAEASPQRLPRDPHPFLTVR
jgi:coenzyme F420-0:L-glutamate ligase/coenzyme F420-1:gamma-L-glutamate ligase